jgi:hypothetical protein
MAKETVAARLSREVREVVERKDRVDHVYVTWHRRVAMVLLDLRNESQISVTKSEESDMTWLSLKDNRPRDERFWCTPFFPLDLPVDVIDGVILDHEVQLSRAEALVEEILLARREAERREKLRTDALNKLTTEEREVLGL